MGGAPAVLGEGPAGRWPVLAAERAERLALSRSGASEAMKPDAGTPREAMKPDAVTPSGKPDAVPAWANGYIRPVDLEEKTIEELPDRCEECGAKLTPAEIQAAMESGGPALCSIHAAEDEPGLAADEAGFLDE